MKILLLSPYPEKILPALHKQADEVVTSMESPEKLPEADWIISFGYRYIIGPVMLARYQGRAVNIHISVLPYNRGSDPNFWSFFDSTPKGVTIHEINQGLDTGPIYDTATIKFREGHTLKTSYETLHRVASLHFAVWWPDIRDQKRKPFPQQLQGTYHRTADKEPYFKLLPLGWDSPVEEVEELGRRHRGETIKNISGV